ncbi:MAG TPA: ABC transporter ATP-binding protein [Nocardioides sp.]|jgi:peptide/nickel transport system ATP-binding protein|uniref:ABC transporter ATP-binding protein n=1 Tax=Nocardioides sp. TaxID=35761 RepID=UPI002E2FA8AD|nr:ABC transporter ATP-binding protein [Nocardioides sp.]HEX3929223.1 ABC transporter ATP-binding protein [Nocardioides sp.]
MALLEVSGLEVFFDLPDGELHAVQGVDLTLEPHDRLGLVGESGSGKTTTVLGLMGLLPPTASVAGSVRLDGRELLVGGEQGADSWRWKSMATVFQGAMNALNPVRTVGWQIAEPMRVHGTASGTARQARVRDLLGLVGLPRAVEHSYPHELSGGMRQRAAIAMALACEPKVLLADEPTTALDVVVQAGILELLAKLTDELSLALVLVTHDLAAAASSCTRMAVMYAGRVVESGPVEEIGTAPAHPYTRRLFASVPDPADDRPVASIPGAPPRLDRPIVGCPFAPRCDVAFDRCQDERPELLDLTATHSSACHHGAESLPPPAPVAHLGVPAGALADGGLSGGSQTPAPVLELADIEVAFPGRRSWTDLLRGRPRPEVRAVDDVSLRVLPGEMLAVVGESGSGKTTMAHTIVGNVEPRAGEVAVAGHDRRTMTRRERQQARQQVQLVYQDPYESLDPRMRVRAILDEPMRVSGVGGRARRAEVADQALRQVGLTPPELFLGRYPHELSGGQRQRVAIAAALVMDPSVVVADEPVSMLDVSIRADVLDVLDGLRRSRSVAVVMITHDLSTAAHYADRIAVMYLGRIVETGPAREVLSNPQHPYTQALMAAAPTLGRTPRPLPFAAEGMGADARVPSGCRFHPRCAVALPSCREHDPEAVTVGPGHEVSCVLPLAQGSEVTVS